MRKINPFLNARTLSVVFIALWGISFGSLELNAKDKVQPTTTDTDLSKKLGTLETKLDKTIKSLNSLSGRVSALESQEKPPVVRYDREIARLDSSIKVLEKSTASLSQDLLKLSRQIELYKRRTAYTDSLNFEILSQLVILENRIVSLSAGLSEAKSLGSTNMNTAVNAVGGNYRDRYLQALTYHQNGQNEQAIALFTQLLQEDKSHELADNAQYWIGECYYSMKQYRRAIIEFEKVFDFKNTNKDDDAQFKLGLCYAALGERENAVTEFQRLIDYYPQSEFVKNAKQFVK
jgi:TolA-binding protein